MKKIFLLLTILFSLKVSAQNTFTCYIKYAKDSTALPQSTAKIMGTKKGAAADSTGKITITNITTNTIQVSFSFVGLQDVLMQFNLPQTNDLLIIYLYDKPNTEEAVIVSSSRTNSRIEDLPTKVEVLGSEEVTEENGIKPGNIASLLGDVAGIQIQQSSATTGNADARIQGLPGKYSQILRDGLPLFGGYSGSFSILQIPPLDLKQIEIIKGSSSTLYGGGAIAGLLNLISKSPKLGKPEKSITLNQSTLKESNANLFFSNRNKNLGYTLFSGGTYQRAVDVNKDGFSDVPDLRTVFFHPRFFIYPNKKQTITLGYNFTYEDRNGGDMQVLHSTKDNLHQFFIKNKLLRNTIDAEWENKLNATDRLTVKGTTSFFKKDITTNVFGMKANQLNYFSEVTYFKKLPKHNIVVGANFTGENFKKQLPDSTLFNNYNQHTVGLFLQDDWKITNKFITQLGLRVDNHNTFGTFVLPRISLLYKINSNFTTRLGGGLGYKTPSQFANDIDERDYKYIVPNNNLVAEKSIGVNWDINYKQVINNWHLTINQMFYITDIAKPVVDVTSSSGAINFYNASKSLNTKGFETYIAATHDELEIYFGYTYTLAKQLYDNIHPYVSLSARNKFATIVAYEFTDDFRAGVEASYTGKQYLDNGNTTPSFLFAAAMMRYDFKKVSLVLNCENLFDYRQTRKENIIYGSVTNPSFKQIWAPIDGRVVNLSAKINL